MLDINEIVVGETEVRILKLPDYVRQRVGDVGVVKTLEVDRFLNIGVDFKEIHYYPSGNDNLWWFSSEHLEIVKNEIKNNDEESIVEYKIGSKFRVVNLDGDLNLEKCGVKVGDVGELIEVDESDETMVRLLNIDWVGDEESAYASKQIYFYKSNIEPFLEKPLVEETIVEDSPKYEKGVTKFKVLNNVDNNIFLFDVKVGDIATYYISYEDVIGLSNPSWRSSVLYFKPHQIELITDSPIQKDFEEITESRWEEIIENIEGGYGLTDEESEIVKSVLKLNKPFNVIPDLVDHVLSREEQTHIDSTHIGDTGNAYFYYKSKILKKWFCWNEEACFWEECEFSYKDGEDLIPVKIGETE